MKILIVDDSRAMRLIVKRTLREAGFDGCTVIEASDGAEALEVIAAESPNIVLSDWNMPNVNGMELLSRLRADAGNQIDFGFITSESSNAMREQAKEAGALFVISKPFTADAFQSALAPVLNG